VALPGNLLKIPSMRTYKSIEKKSAILGMPLMDIALLLFMLIGLIMAGSVASIFISVSKYYYLCILLLIIGTYCLLKVANRKAHPAFILCLISFYFRQPKKITLLK
jgi:hypothetical membrane protein